MDFGASGSPMQACPPLVTITLIASLPTAFRVCKGAQCGDTRWYIACAHLVGLQEAQYKQARVMQGGPGMKVHVTDCQSTGHAQQVRASLEA